ncbi:MAG: hypothetical protein MMC33_002062 [Icmadophila ericetorum]|nr:hypothetical protein [Icmadophila ericetorum]
MVLLKNIAVSILADGEQLPEYVDAEHTTTQISNTVSRYVKTVPGAELMIKYESLLPEDHRYMHQQEPHHPCLVFQFYLNGRWVGFRLLDHETRTSIFRAILWLPEDTMVLSTLNFSENTFWEDIYLEEEDLGDIVVKVQRAFNHSLSAEKFERYFDFPPAGVEIGQALGRPMSIVLQSRFVNLNLGLSHKASEYHPTQWSSLDAEEPPFAKFKFKYRSTYVLKQLGLIPLPPDESKLHLPPGLTRQETVHYLAVAEADVKSRAAGLGSPPPIPLLDESIDPTVRRSQLLRLEMSAAALGAALDHDRDDEYLPSRNNSPGLDADSVPDLDTNELTESNTNPTPSFTVYGPSRSNIATASGSPIVTVETSNPETVHDPNQDTAPHLCLNTKIGNVKRNYKDAFCELPVIVI